MIAGHTRALFLTAVAVLSGCGGPAFPTPDGLAYGPPDPDPVTYTVTDTTAFTIETGTGPLEVVTAYSGTAELDFRQWPRDRRVAVRFPRFRGSFRNPTQAPSVVDESAIDGAFGVRLSPAGEVMVVDTPALADPLLDVVGPETLVRTLFVHLPASSVDVGATWVDTVTTAQEVGGTRTEARSVVVSTLAGDTMVSGRRLLLIRTEAGNRLRVTGVSGGVEVEQQLTGSTRGTVLWDDRSRRLVERWARGALEGTLTLPGVEMAALPVRVVIRRAVQLEE